MELLLWRWSTLAQAVSDLLIAAFFLALSRSLQLPNVRSWALAWVFNLLALTTVALYWMVLPHVAAVAWLTFGAYLFSKSMFVLLVAAGTVALADGKPPPLLTSVAAASLAYAVIGTPLAVPRFHLLGLIQSVLIAVAFSACALYLLRNSVVRSGGWLALGLGLRALLAVFELFGNIMLWRHGAEGPGLPIGLLMAAASSLDTAAEWVIALASLLVFHELVQHDLNRSNSELREAQQSLHDLLQRDQLTGVYNRRALPALLGSAQARGAGILFFDLDHFKHVNDRHGHHVGDDCLVRFAQALKASFRADDHIVRFAGDEFVVVTSAAQVDALHGRVAAVRKRLDSSALGPPTLDFSVGIATLAPGGDGNAALRAADQAMYADKARYRQLT